MSTSAKAILENIKALPPVEFRELFQQISFLNNPRSDRPQNSAISEEEFEAALAEVTGCTAGEHGLSRLLADRRRERDRDEDYLKSRLSSSHG
jgi:hypothetical protein